MNKLLLRILILLFTITSSYALECSADGLVTGVEISLDDNSFSKNFDGTSGIIYKLDFDESQKKYTLWQTNLLTYRTDMGNNIVSYSGLNPATNLLDASDLGKVLSIDTSKYQTIYVKEKLKNTGSCSNYRYQTLKHYSRILDVGGSGKGFTLSDFGSRIIYVDIGNENTQVHSMNIKDFYSGDYRIRSWLRKGSNPYSPTFQIFEIKLDFIGSALYVPQVTRLDSGVVNPLVEGGTYKKKYRFHNPSPINKKNVTFDVRTWPGDANPSLNINNYDYLNRDYRKITLNPKETKIIEYDYTIPYEKDESGLNYYRFAEYIRYVDDPVLGSRYLIRSWPKIGSLDHSYLSGDILGETFVQGTTNQGVPYFGTEFLLKEYNAYLSKNVPSGKYDYEILAYKKNSTTSWNLFYTNRTTYNQNVGVNSNAREQFIYPLYDFENWIDETIRLDLNTYWNAKNWRFYYDTTQRGNFNVELDFSHLLMSTDLPFTLYPQGGSDKFYVRDVLFNLKDYRLRNVSLDVEIVDPVTGIQTPNFQVTNPTYFDVPAKASYPVPIKILYKGPVEDEKYRIKINYSYYDEINNKNISKMHYGDIYIKNNPVTSSYYDIIPTRIDYGNLYVNKTSSIEVLFENQGNSPFSTSHDVSLYYRNLSSNIFQLIGTNSVSSTQNMTTFNFKPQYSGEIILKAVIDETNSISENSAYISFGELNNQLASISFVRDIDVVLEYAKPLYDNITTEGVIPFEIRISNDGVGGIDEFDLNLNISWQNDYWYFNDTYYNIPEEGRTFVYNWNVTDVTPGVHVFNTLVEPLYDSEYTNNQHTGYMNFCPLPWYSSPRGCFSSCDSTCVDKSTNRYVPSCDGINGCNYYNKSFALTCGGYTQGSYAQFNETHIAMCPSASKIIPNIFTNKTLEIDGDCTEIRVDRYPTLFRGENVLMSTIICKKE